MLGNPSGLRQFLGEVGGRARTAWARRAEEENASGAGRLQVRGSWQKRRTEGREGLNKRRVVGQGGRDGDMQPIGGRKEERKEGVHPWRIIKTGMALWGGAELIKVGKEKQKSVCLL